MNERRSTSDDSARPIITRPRLVERLQQRFQHRLTFVVGGGGSGKTTALRQAVAAEVDHVDIVHVCTPVDRESGRLTEHLMYAGLGDSRHQSPSIEALVERVLNHSPKHVCFVIDDTHHLDDLSLVAELLEQLPRNGHVLLAGRRRPDLSTARLDAAGAFDEVLQPDLLMTEQEQIDFANLRGIDRSILAGAEGWPAFVELAASGAEVRSRRYLEEEALRDIAPDRRLALARFAFVGGGTEEVSLKVTGLGLDELLGDLPLTRTDGNRAKLHDLWGDVLIDELTVADRREAALAASEVLRASGSFDEAIDLSSSVGEWPETANSIGAAVRHGVDGGLRIDQLRRWRALLPMSLAESPVALLVDGLIQREVDPTAEEAWTCLERAADGFAADPEGKDLELVALLQLGYVSRIGGRPERLAPIVERTAVLADTHPPARPFLAFGEAWIALAQGKPDVQLAAMQRLGDDDLPPVWQVTRDHLIAHALFNLGRPHEGLERVPREIETLPMPIPGALVTESQCLWYAGRPDQAVARRPSGMDSRYGARDRFIAGAWSATMFSYTGDVAAAKEALDVARDNQGEQPSVMVAAQLLAVELLIRLAEGDEDGVAVELGGILEQIPLGSGVSEQMIRNHLTIPYVLLPETRPYWNEAELGPSLRTSRQVAAAFVAARDGDLAPLRGLEWPEPGVIVSQFPVRWAVEFALRGLAAGCDQGRPLTRWLCEQWGEPARVALRSWVDHDELGPAARDVLSRTPSPPSHRTEVRVLGHTQVLIDGYSVDSPDLRRERSRALLALLILKRSATRDELAGMLWPDHTVEKAAKNLRTTLSYVHGLLEPRRAAGDAPWFVRLDGHHIRLNPALAVDGWRFVELLNAADEAERLGQANVVLPLLLEAVGLWRGDLAADLDVEFLELERIHLRSRFVRASCRAAELLVAVGRPEEAVDIARPALEIDRWSERSYLALAEAYAALGDRTAAAAVIAQGRAATGLPLAAV